VALGVLPSVSVTSLLFPCGFYRCSIFELVRTHVAVVGERPFSGQWSSLLLLLLLEVVVVVAVLPVQNFSSVGVVRFAILSGFEISVLFDFLRSGRI
jgi:hypothetical protein